VTTRAASHEEEVLLDLPGGSPILAMQRHAFDHSGRLIERAELVYRPDRYTVEFTMVDRP
jgi:DNA-binding GntR family transcriptional regulator